MMLLALNSFQAHLVLGSHLEGRLFPEDDYISYSAFHSCLQFFIQGFDPCESPVFNKSPDIVLQVLCFVFCLFVYCFGLFETIPCCMAQAGLEFIDLVIDSLASFEAEITVVYHQAWQCVP